MLNFMLDLTCHNFSSLYFYFKNSSGKSNHICIKFIPCFLHNVSLYGLLLFSLSTKLQTSTDRAKCHKPEGTSREGSPKKEKINRKEGKKDKNTI